MTIDSNISNSIEISSETQTNSYLNSFNNNLSLNFSQTNESNLITNILNKTQTFDTNCLQLSPTKVLNNFSTNHNLITSSVSNEPNVVDIDSSDNSIEFNNEIMNDSLLLPSIPSLSPQKTTKILRNDVQNSESKKSYTEVANNSLPMFIIPSTNQSTSSSFVSMMSSNEDKNWFKNITENDFCLKLNHLKLSYGSSGQRVTFSSIEGSVVSKQLIVDISGHFDVKVLGLSISAKNSFYRLVPNVIKNQLEFNSILNSFSKWKVCVANESTDRVLEDKIIAIRAFVCNTTNTIRSRNCELFLPEIGSIRCKYCRILLNRIRKLKTFKT